MKRLHAIKPLPAILTGLLATTIARAAETDAEAAADSVNLWDLLQQGGWAMYPLGACSMVMFFLIFYSWRETERRRFMREEAIHQLEAPLNRRDLTQGRNLIAAKQTILDRCLESALRKARPDQDDGNAVKVEESFVEQMGAEENATGQFVTYLNVIASVAPMIGLLGTVSGMIGAFQKIGRGGMGRPELLAGNIGEALITTATGLVIGIPAMIAYFVMRNRLTNGMLAVSQAGSDLIDALRESKPVELESED